MVDLPLRNFQQIVADQTATLAASLSVNSDTFQSLNLTPGSPLLALMEANGGVALWQQFMNWKVLRATRMQTSRGADLDTFGADFGFARYPATPATGQVHFTRSTANSTIYIPANAVLRSKDGSQAFVVVPPIANSSSIFDPTQGYRMDINVYSISVLVQAVTPGTAGNIDRDQLKLQSGLPITSVTNPLAFVTGNDAESDAQYISRFRLYINSLSRATHSALENAIINTNPNYSYTILENYIAAGQQQPGAVLVNFDDGNGLGLNLLTPGSVAASQTAGIVNELKYNLDAVRPLGVTLFVQPAQACIVQVSMMAKFANTAIRLSSVQQIEDAVSTYINSLAVGQTLFWTKLFQVIYNSCPNLIEVTNLTTSATDQYGNPIPPGLSNALDIEVSTSQALRFLPNPPNGLQGSLVTIGYA